MSGTDALQSTLAAEHAAVWTYAVLAARTSQTSEPQLYARLLAGHQQHRGLRDQLELMISAAGQVPDAAQPAYPSPAGDDAAQRAAAALAVEEACSVAYAWQVSHASGEQRAWAVAALTWSAVHSVGLGAAPVPWPGAPELATG